MHFYYFRQMANKKHIFFLASFLLSFISVSYPTDQTSINKIIKSNRIADVLTYADQDTLVAFDLDNTLMEGVHDFSCPAWYDYRVEIFQSRGLNYAQAIEKQGQALAQIKDVNIFQAVERPETLEVIKTLQDKNIKTIGLTVRLFATEVSVTEKHLLQSNIDLCRNAVYDKELILDNGAGFCDGIVFSGLQTKKGELLLEFLEKINYVPKKIVFIDDSMKHVQHVHDALTKKGIPSVCIRYGYTDARIARIDGKVADKQLCEVLGEDRYNKVFGETKKKDDLWDGNHYKDNSKIQKKTALSPLSEISFKDSDTILDIGCGDGKITADIAKKVSNGRVLGIDISENMIKTAQENFSDIHNLSFMVMDACDISLDQKFDYVFSFFTIHWIKDQLSIFKRVNKLLKPGGKMVVIIATPESYPANDAFRSFKEKGLWSQALENKENRFHQKTEEQAYALLKDAGFDDIKVETVWGTHDFQTRDVYVNSLMGWIPHCINFSHDEALEFCTDFAGEVYMQQNKKEHEVLTYKYPLLRIEACSKKTDLWNGKYYNKNSKTQKELATSVLNEITFKQDETILDIGCGDGKITAAMASRVPLGNVLGLDISPSMVRTAQEYFSDRDNLSFVVNNAANFSCDQTFDYVFSFFTIHWIKDQLSVFKNIKKVLILNG